MEYTEKQLAVIEEKKEEPVQFEITTTQTLEFSIFGLEAEIARIQSDIELSQKRVIDLEVRKKQLEGKLDEVKEKILEKYPTAEN